MRTTQSGRHLAALLAVARAVPIPPGAPFFLRLGAPHKAIVGFGYFARYERVPARLARESFGVKNGTDTLADMAARIENQPLRGEVHRVHELSVIAGGDGDDDA